MAHLSLLALLRLVSENSNLLALAGLYNLACYLCALNIRCADLDTVVSAYSNNVEIYGCVVLCVKLLNIDNVAVSYLVLLPPVSIIAYIVFIPLFKTRYSSGGAMLTFICPQ